MGTFWVFPNGGQGVSIYDPVKNSIVKTLTNVTLSPPAGYGDTVWMKDSTGTKNYVYISENTVGKQRMHYYDATTQLYLGNVPSTAGGKPLHTYAVPFRYEVYSHLDIASGFDVFTADSITTKTALAYQVELPWYTMVYRQHMENYFPRLDLAIMDSKPTFSLVR